MKYLSVCSGIEAASVAWAPFGWEPWAFSEIDPFPSSVLAHHYPHVPNLGDMTQFEDWPYADIDLLCGGTPCQSFSVAGLRKGLDDPRGNLMLTFAAIAAKYRPRWVVWENVPGVLSSNRGRDFASLLGILSGRAIEPPAGGWQNAGVIPGITDAYGLAWRVLDAQYIRVDGYGRAVPQRRRRVFLVGYLGDWRRAAAVLFERESLSGHPPPSRGTGARVAACLTRGAESSGRGGYAGRRQEDDYNIVAGYRQVEFGEYAEDGTASTIKQRDYKSATDRVAHTLRGEGFDASEDGTGRGVPLVFDPAQVTSRHNRSNPQPGGPSFVRRLTPRECERLQGFPDDFTRIPWRGKPAEECPDGPRYKAIGNSWAVNCARWIGRRIERVEEIQ